MEKQKQEQLNKILEMVREDLYKALREDDIEKVKIGIEMALHGTYILDKHINFYK